MICRRFAPAALAALTLAACGGPGPDALPTYCPSPFTVTDAGRLTHFKDGPGRDPRDIAYEAVVASSRTTCEASRNNQISVTLLMRISVSAGPSVGTGPTRVPYFVRVIDGSGAVVQGQEFTADFRLSTANPRGSSQEELSLFLPQGSSYRIAIGLKPTAEELNYNRRGRQ
jgi:hypothetical protein